MSEMALPTEVLDSFIALTHGLQKLSDSIRQDQDKYAWVQPEYISQDNSDVNSAREKVITALNQLQYLPNQLPREIIICAGFVGATEETLQLATQVNQLKDHFKKSILSLKSLKISPNDPTLQERFSEIILRAPSTSVVLRNLGLSRLHLKQCYRKIPILTQAPSKISWTWAHTRSIKKISLETAQNLLMKRGKDVGIQIQLAKLGKLAPNEHLAIVQELAPHLRANLVFKTDVGNERRMIKGPLPIFFPVNETTPLPSFSPPDQKCEKNQSRVIRSDVKIDPEVYLPAIRAHRYANK